MVRKLSFLAFLLFLTNSAFGQYAVYDLDDNYGLRGVIEEKADGDKSLAEAVAWCNTFNKWGRTPDYIRIIANSDNASFSVEALRVLTNQKVDLSYVTGTAIYKFKNNMVKYLIWPDKTTKEQVNELTPKVGGSIQSALSISPSEYTYAESTEKGVRLTVYNKVPGTLKNVIEKVEKLGRYAEANNQYNYGPTAVTEIVMSGNLNALDMLVGSNTCVNDQGHMTDEYIYSNKVGALNNANNIRSIDLSDALFGKGNDYHPEDMAISRVMREWSSLVNIVFPLDASQHTIPANCLKNQGGLTSVCIPGNIKRIESNAFNNDYAITRYTTTAVDANGNGRGEVIDNGENSLTLPAGLEFIGTGAFWNDTQIKEIYCLSYTAPECQKDAFDSALCCGNGGHTPVGSNIRRGYSNMGILHWPSDIDATNLARYTDPTRKYSLVDELQTKDANGNILQWPTQDEYLRAYQQASNGYLWGAWDLQCQSDLGMWSYNSISQDKANSAYQRVNPSGNSDVVFYDNGIGTSYNTSIYNKDYRGWHQFVLAYPVEMEGVEHPTFEVPEVAHYAETDWYSFCVPFDMTDEDVMKVFGVEAKNGTVQYLPFGQSSAKVLAQGQKLVPNITTLTRVRRDVPKKTIYLDFCPNRCDIANNDYQVVNNQIVEVAWNHKKNNAADQEYNVDENGKRILIRAGYPYLIKGYLPVGVTAAEKEALANYNTSHPAYYAMSAHKEKFTTSDRDYENVPGKLGQQAKLPYTKWVINAVDANGREIPSYDDNAFQYVFLGSYTGITVPKYAYFVGKSKSQGQNIWFYKDWNAGEPGENGATAPEVYWPSLTSIVTAFPGRSASIGYTERTYTTHEGNEYHKSWDLSFNNDADHFTVNDSQTGSPIRVRPVVAFSFGRSAVSAIQEVEADGRVVTAPFGSVYNLRGQKVAEEGQLQSLPKGVYVINGKKFVVK